MRMIGRVYTHVLVARETWGESMGMVRPGKWLHAFAYVCFHTLSTTNTHRWYNDLYKIVQFGSGMSLYATANQADRNHH